MNQRPYPERFEKPAAPRFCPACGREITVSDARFCPFCGKPFGAEPLPVYAAPVPRRRPEDRPMSTVYAAPVPPKKPKGGILTPLKGKKK